MKKFNKSTSSPKIGLFAPITLLVFIILFSFNARAQRPLSISEPICTPERLEELEKNILSDIACDVKKEGALNLVSVPVVIQNPNNLPADSLKFSLYLPKDVEPILPITNGKWNPETRILSLTFSSNLKPLEEREVKIDFAQKPGICVMYGILEGRIAGKSFCERRGPVVSSVSDRSAFTVATQTILRAVRSDDAELAIISPAAAASKATDSFFTGLPVAVAFSMLPVLLAGILSYYFISTFPLLVTIAALAVALLAAFLIKSFRK